MKKIVSIPVLSLVMAASMTAIASAHVVVTPAQAGVGSRNTFSISVPNEKQTPVTALKITVPSNLSDVQPTVHPGWTITTDKDGQGNITSINWNGGNIPVGQRDDFTFKAQVPAQATEIDWKAYQTYGDGSTVAWDQKPTNGGDDDSGSAGPYSVTKVVNDLTPASSATSTTATKDSGSTQTTSLTSLGLSLLAVILSVFALLRQRAQSTDKQ